MSGIRVVRPESRDRGTAQTPGMERAAGVSAATAGSAGVWMGHVTTAPGFRSGAHHHGDAESAIYIMSGRCRFRWGAHLEESEDCGEGDFIFVPAGLVHQEINLSEREPVVFIVARGSQENVVVNVEMPEAEM